MECGSLLPPLHGRLAARRSATLPAPPTLSLVEGRNPKGARRIHGGTGFHPVRWTG